AEQRLLERALVHVAMEEDRRRMLVHRRRRLLDLDAPRDRIEAFDRAEPALLVDPRLLRTPVHLLRREGVDVGRHPPPALRRDPALEAQARDRARLVVPLVLGQAREPEVLPPAHL